MKTKQCLKELMKKENLLEQSLKEGFFNLSFSKGAYYPNVLWCIVSL